MKESELLRIVMNHLVQCEGMSNIFSADEIKEWPSGAFEFFKTQKLLKTTKIAQSVECNGCEENCLMPVTVRTSEISGKTQAFISCDKPADIGRVNVKPSRLVQWKITGLMLATKLIAMLNFENEPTEKQGGKSWELGVLKSKVNRPHVVLNIENGVRLKIGTHELDLLDVLSFKNGKLILDVEELFRIADKTEKPPKYNPSVVKRAARSLKTEERNKKIQKIYRKLKTNKPNMTDTWRAKQIHIQFKDVLAFESIRKIMKLEK